MKKHTSGSSSKSRRKTTTTTPRRTKFASSTTPLSVTKHDVSVGSASLPKSWQAFRAKPNLTTARTVASELQSMRPAAAKPVMKLVADQLAELSPKDRSTMSRLIMAELMTDQARDFLKVTATTRLKHPVVEIQQPPTAQHDNVAHYLDLVPPKNLKKAATLPKSSKIKDAQLLNALDLYTADDRMVKLAALEQRTDNVADASSMGHLKQAAQFVAGLNSGKVAYSAKRREELAPTVQGTKQAHLASQMGFRKAPTQRDDVTSLSTQNDMVTTYWRSTFEKAVPAFVSGLQTKVKIEEGDFLVNSPRVLRKIEMLLGAEVAKKLTVEPLQGRAGVSVLKGTQAVKDILWPSVLHELGSAPSAYQLYELMDVREKAPPTNFKVDTRADLIQLMTSSAFSQLQEIARSSRQLAPVCAMVENLVLGLTDELGPDRFDTLTANAMKSMAQLLDIIVANEHNPTVSMRAVDLMMDEIGLVVAAAKNYNIVDYRDTMRAITLERAPSIEPLVTKETIQLDNRLVSSGMDSLSTALHIALSARGHDKVARPTDKVDYFETGMLLERLKKGETVAPASDVLVAALNPSTPFVPADAGKLVKDVQHAVSQRKKGDPPFALILDTTIQLPGKPPKDPTQLDDVLGGLKEQIANGSLEVFLCKSFQKYASFGTGKVSAADLTMLSKKGNLDSAFSRAEALLTEIDLDLASHDEAQLVIHMLRHGHRDELSLITHAAENAKFVDAFCWPIEADYAQGSKYVDGIPLLLRSTPTGRVGSLFEHLVQVDLRDSFSFLRTSYVAGIPGPWPEPTTENMYVRINTGHEPKGTMVENFYAFGHLSSNLLPGTTAKSGDQVDLGMLATSVVAKHLRQVPIAAQTDPMVKQYQNNIIASYCAFGLQNATPKMGMINETLKFFAHSAEGVSIETQRYLARELFTFYQTRAAPTDTELLAGLCNAALVLPASELKAFAAKLNLTKAGDSKEAKLLREIVDRAKRV